MTTDAEWEEGEAMQAECERRTADRGWLRVMRSPRPVSIAAWWRCARRGQVWWPGKTFTIDLREHDEDYRCCTLSEGHTGGSKRQQP